MSILFAVICITGYSGTVQNIPNATLVKLNEEHFSAYEQSRSGNRKVLIEYPVANAKTKVLKKTTDLEVLDVFRTNPSASYELYLVLYKNGYYFLDRSQVLDNGILDDVALEEQREHERLVAQLQLKTQNYLSEMRRVRDLYCTMTDSLNNDMTDLELQKTRSITEKLAPQEHLVDSLYDLDVQEYNKALIQWENDVKKWGNKLPSKERLFLNSIELDGPKLEKPNTAGGCDVYMRYKNLSEKTIKYFTFTLRFKNAVNDYVSCSIRGSSPMKCKDTGPVSTNMSGGGVWDCVIYNYSATRAICTGITITYMDGSTVSFSQNEISDVQLALSSKPKKPEMKCSNSYEASKDFNKLREIITRTESSAYNKKISADRTLIDKYKRQIKHFALHRIEDIVLNEPDDFNKGTTPLRKEMEKAKEELDKFEAVHFVDKVSVVPEMFDSWNKENKVWQKGWINKSASRNANKILDDAESMYEYNKNFKYRGL